MNQARRSYREGFPKMQPTTDRDHRAKQKDDVIKETEDKEDMLSITWQYERLKNKNCMF